VQRPGRINLGSLNKLGEVFFHLSRVTIRNPKVDIVIEIQRISTDSELQRSNGFG
jgi:hypothetical protein